MPSEIRAVPDDNFTDLADDKLVTRADMAALVGVQINTVRIWAQTSPDFPESLRVPGFKPVFHRWSEVRDWLCRTGRMPCPETSDLIAAGAAAEMIGVAPSTFKQMRMRGRFPEPDARVQRAPFWYPLTIKRWLRERGR
jgi:hypothetical protein